MAKQLPEPNWEAYNQIAKHIDAIQPAEEVVAPAPTNPKGNPENLVPWKPGQEGGGRGRPKQTALDAALKKAMNMTHKNGLTIAENMAWCMIQMAMSGNVSMCKLIAERVGGLPTAKIEQDSELRVIIERVG